jgi:hypothetical protein
MLKKKKREEKKIKRNPRTKERLESGQLRKKFEKSTCFSSKKISGPSEKVKKWLFIWFFKKKQLKDVAVMIGKRVWKERHFIKNFCQWEGPDSDGLFRPTILF